MSRQSDLRFTFEPASGTAFEVIEFHLTEALSEPFCLELELASANAAVDFGDLLDQPALFTLWHGDQKVRWVHGLVSAFEQGDTGFRRTRYRAVVQPTLARAGLRSDWRIFQQQTVPQILQTILKRSGITDAEQRLTRDHLAREYCVQPGETDLHFFQRLSAEEGFYYAFTHGAQGHRVIHSDRLYIHGTIEGGPVTYNATPGGDQAEPCLRRFHYIEQVRTARQTQRDYTFRLPRYDLQSTSQGMALDHQGQNYERYNFPGRYKNADGVGKPFTDTRLLALRRDAQIATVEGDDARLQPGLAFDLEGHPRHEWNTGWRTVRMSHHGTQHTSQQEESAEAEQGTHYSYTAEIIPDRTEWKAPLYPKPRIDGPQVATVAGPAGEEIFCDEYGRVRVQFPWDRYGNNDEHSSCWMRVSQNWAGAAWGHIAIPRIGHEVIVDFLDGDPDQPIITGRTYNAPSPTPYELPLHKTRMTIKSQTHKGEGFNELRFEDEKDQEEVYIHAQKDQNIHVNHDETTFIGNDRKEDVEHDETIAIGHDRAETVGNDEQVTIGHDRRHSIGQDAFLIIERNHTITIGKDRVEQVGNHRKDQTTANHLIDVGGHVEQTVQGHHKLSAGQSIERQTRLYQLEVGESAVLRGPGGTITLSDDGVTLAGVAIRFKGPLTQEPHGIGHPFAIIGNPAPGSPSDFCITCFLRAALTGSAAVPV